MDPTNLYAPPTASTDPRPAQTTESAEDTRRARRGQVAWLILFGLNLIVPGWFAAAVDGNRSDKWTGITLAVLMLAAIGWRFLVVRPGMIGVAVRGAVLMALGQFFPVVQFVAGMLGVGLTQSLPEFGADNANRLGLVRGFVATSVTGLVLLVVSLILGFTLQGIGRIFRAPSAPKPRPVLR